MWLALNAHLRQVPWGTKVSLLALLCSSLSWSLVLLVTLSADLTTPEKLSGKAYANSTNPLSSWQKPAPQSRLSWRQNTRHNDETSTSTMIVSPSSNIAARDGK